MLTRLARQWPAALLLLAAVWIAAGAAGGPAHAAPAPAPPPAPRWAPRGADEDVLHAVWARNDQPVAAGKVGRGYLWGPRALVTRYEAWAESPSGTRLVQYWDKARMEISNPAADPSGSGYVSNGRLVYEMVGGLIQTGANRFDNHPPAGIPVAGDDRSANPEAPAYGAFRGAASILPGESQWVDRTGQPILTWIDYRGVVNREAYLGGYGVKYGQYVPQTHHNVADVFWTFLNQQGIVYQGGAYVTAGLFDWVHVTGYPIAEPYWITARVGGRPYAVLVQLFERRTLTYTPLESPAYQVQMGNVGQHYLAWRYGP